MDAFLREVRSIAVRVGRKKNLYENNPNILWLHGSMCDLIVSAYGHVHNHLSRRLQPRSMMITEEMFPTALKPAADNLVAVMMAGERFVDWCKCDDGRQPHGRDDDRGHDPLNYDQELVWMQKALYGGLSSELIDIHIHNFLLAMCTLGDSIRNLAPAGQGARHDALQAPDAFWMNGEATYPAYILINALELEQARNDDIRQIENYVERILGRIDSGLQAAAWNADIFKRDLAKLLLEKLKDHETPHLADYSTIPHGVPQETLLVIPGILLWVRDNGPVIGPMLHCTDHVMVMEAQWSPAGSDKTFALKRLSLIENYGFASEARIHLRLHHPNIVQSLCGFVDSQSSGYILMELMDWNLAQYIRHRKAQNMSLAEQIHIMLQIAKGMEYLHSRGIMHRDLKPENVLITDSQVQPVEYDPHGASTSSSTYVQGLQLYESVQVKIADFNFATTIENGVFPDSDHRYTRTSGVGTTIYRAPEVMRRDGEGGLKYSQEVDVYSFGAVCFMMFFIGSEESEEAEDTLKRNQDRERSSRQLNALKGKCPWYLQRWIEAWLDPDPQARPTFKDICRVLRHLYSVVLRSGPTLPPFLSEAVDENTWRTVQEKVMQEMQRFERFKEEKEWGSLCSVVEIPYEMHLMNVMECVLNKALALAPPANPKPKSGVLACLLSCFQFCMSEAPIANRRAGIK